MKNENGETITPTMKGYEDTLNLIARVQNLEALAIMLATTIQTGTFDPEVKKDVDTFREAFWVAQTRRGASHLADGSTSEVFI